MAVRTEGAILPPSVLQRIHAVDEKLGGLKPEDFGLSGTRVREAASQAWNALQGPWLAFKAKREQRGYEDISFGPAGDWVRQILRALDYGNIEMAGRGIAVGEDGRFRISATLCAHVPLYVVGHGQPLDKRPASGGATPHGNVQLFLNATEANLWGFVTNGLQWRILRDSVSLSRQAMVEVDLEAVFEGGLYDEFLLFFLLCHESRVRSERPSECWLERWSQTAGEEGKRALDTLRDGVQKAIESLGQGFLRHSSNGDLRERLRSGELDKQDYYRQLLRLVYRLLFLFVAEDRDLLASPQATEEQRRLYRDAYSTQRLRLLAERLRGAERHHDLYVGLRLVLAALGDKRGCPELGIAPLGGLFLRVQTLDLDGAEISNYDLLEATRCLAVTREGGRRARVDYKNLGSEELGSVYESLLELHPELNLETARFELRTASGNERKTTGSYYTPDSLIQCLLDTALEPVVAEALRTARIKFKERDGEPPEAQAILDLKVVDPAVGSGHFLISAAHRLAKRLAQVRTGDEEPSPVEVRRALRDVIGKCLYGIDMNPMAAELCKVALWLEAMEPGRPLAFLDHHIQVGNSLLGTTPELIAQGIPDEAFDAIEGDDKALCATLKKQNKAERAGQTSLFAPEVFAGKEALKAFQELEVLPDATLDEVERKDKSYRAAAAALALRRQIADAWCAAFVLPKTSPKPGDPTSGTAVTTSTLRAMGRGVPLDSATQAAVADAVERFGFLHPHLAFPEVFAKGGFDVVLGNPPWERVKLQEKEFFAERQPEVAAAKNKAERDRMIKALVGTALHGEFLQAKRDAEASSAFMRKSGRFPLAGRGDVNTYAVFAELMRSLLNPAGRSGVIVPSGIATDDTTKAFFQDIVDQRSLVSLFDFQSGPGLWSEIGHARFKFCLLTTMASGSCHDSAARVAFFLRDAALLKEPQSTFELSAEEIALLNPNSRTCPIFRTRRDAEITKEIYHRVPVLIREGAPNGNPWGISFQRMFDMSNDSGLFRTREELEEAEGCLEGNQWTVSKAATVRGRPVPAGRWLPLYEAKMIHHFDHRWATFPTAHDLGVGIPVSEAGTRPLSHHERESSAMIVLPRYWVHISEADKRMRVDRGWMTTYRWVTNATNERTFIVALTPRSAAGNSQPVIHSTRGAASIGCLVSCLSSMVFDYATRQKLGGVNMTFGITEQLPVVVPEVFTRTCPWDANTTVGRWVLARLVELVYTAVDMEPFARDLGFDGPPFSWNEERRFVLRAELDAAFFHLYGISRDDVEFIVDTFHIVRENDLKTYGRNRTKETILEIYDEMAAATHMPLRQETSLPRSYPATEGERVQVALAHAVVRRADGATSPDVLGAVILAQNPELCRGYLSTEDQAKYDLAVAAVRRHRPTAAPLDWRECRSYLEDLASVRIERSGNVERIFLEGGLPNPLASIADDVALYAEYGLLALRRARKGLEGTQGADRQLDGLMAQALGAGGRDR